MVLRYETGVATLVQFIAMGLLNIGNTANSIASSCRTDSSCSTDIFVSIIFYLLLMGWFGFVCLLGYLAQDRRSKRFALPLIGAELLIAAVAYLNARHYTDVLSLVTSVTDIILAFWIIYLATRLLRSDGGRITRNRPRRRRRPTPQNQ